MTIFVCPTLSPVALLLPLLSVPLLPVITKQTHSTALIVN